MDSYRHNYDNIEKCWEKIWLLLPEWNVVSMPNFPHMLRGPKERVEQRPYGQPLLKSLQEVEHGGTL